MIRVKVCGITNLKDAMLAAELGAYAIGFVFYTQSKRYIEPNEAKKIVEKLPPFLLRVGVFVDETTERIREIKEYVSLDRIQLYKEVPGIDRNIIIRALRIKNVEDLKEVEKSPYFPLLDSYTERYGGSGKRFDWQLLKMIRKPYILAGGITIENLEEVARIKPYAIDIATGLEKSPGKKDEIKMKKFFERIKKYEE